MKLKAKKFPKFSREKEKVKVGNDSGGDKKFPKFACD